jgi:hypothetical protein
MKNSRRQTKEQLADLLTKHSVWIHNGHGSLTNGLLGVREVSQGEYEGAWIGAAGDGSKRWNTQCVFAHVALYSKGGRVRACHRPEQETELRRKRV